MSIFLILLLYFSQSKTGFLENPCGTMTPRGYDEDWGIGVYYIPEGFVANVYKDTLDNKFGTIDQNGLQDFIDNKLKKNEINYKDIDWVDSYSNILLKAKESQSNRYLNIFWKTNEGGYLIKKADLELNGATFYRYKDLLFDTTITLKDRRFFEWANIGVNLNKHCLNLRKEPSIESELIECIYGNYESKFQEGVTHMKIIDYKSVWAKVEVCTYIYQEGDEDCPSKLKSKRVGWLKAIDQSGFPNIWYSVAGY